MYVASALERHGHDVAIYDINALRHDHAQVREFILAADYDWVGIGGIITTYAEVKTLAENCHVSHPGKPILVGGPVGSTIPRIILEKTRADAVCMGEGEGVALDFSRELLFADGYGLAHKTGGKLHIPQPPPPMHDLDTYLPARHLVPMHIYLENPIGGTNTRKWQDGKAEENVCNTVLMSSRGCPYHCTYCAHNFGGYPFRQRKPEAVVQEMMMLQAKYGCTYLHFVDDMFMANPRWVMEFCKLAASRLDIKWGCTGRVNIANEKILAAMQLAGCTHISYGVESGSQTILDAIKKGVTVAQAANALRLTRNIIGSNTFSMMFGFPEDTDQTMRESIEFCRDVRERPEAIFFPTPYPGTAMYAAALAQGLIDDEEAYVLKLGEQGRDIALNLSIWSDDELRQRRDAMLGEMG
jgi:radical SAM superfamily enzyme YgiQ (UPF0313 family)